MNEATYQSWSRTISFLLKLVGIAGILFCPVFWAFTDRIELAFLPFFGTLAGVGQGLDVLREMQAGRAEGELAPTAEPTPTVAPTPSRGELPPSSEEGETASEDVPPRDPPKRRARNRRRPRDGS